MKICVATGSRAEYGLLKPLLNILRTDTEFVLQVLVTGSHLSPEFGLTFKQIEDDGFIIDAKVEMLLSSDTAVAITKSMGLGMISFADALNMLKPDLLIVLGDRYEMLSIASTALILKIPIAHIHGGEITEGAYDDAIRHAITKLSHLHFTSTEAYRERVIQLGEHPDTVFNVGAIGLDNIVNMDFLGKEELERQLGVKFHKYNYIIAFHPETLSNVSVEEQFKNLLSSIESQDESFFVFTKSNADTNGRIINQLMEEYVNKNKDKSALFPSLGSSRFLSLMKIADAIIGNSSSGIIEAPSVNTMTINIGDRQKGRIQSTSVINCECTKDAIENAFIILKREIKKTNSLNLKNPYGNGQTSLRIVEVLKKVNNNRFGIKTFYDIKYETI